MTSETKEFINDLTQIVISSYNITIPITKMDDVVKQMRGTVIENDDFDSDSDGSIKKTSNNTFEIKISKNQTNERRNFTIAHELGHLFLHMGYRTNDELWEKQDNCVYNRFGKSEQEFQANEFAASLLMPEDKYIEYFRDIYTGNFEKDIKNVSSHFNVSVSAASNRGKFLGYF